MLTYDRLICGIWRFGSLHSLHNASHIRLASDGRIADYDHPNERSWTCEDGVLRIFRADGGLMWQSKRVDDHRQYFQIILTSPNHGHLLFCLEQRVENSHLPLPSSQDESITSKNYSSSNIAQPNTKTPIKIAIASVVRNEATDILAWIGWYFNLGVDTILFYDDSSTDGTLELVSDASLARDIRLHSVTSTTEPARCRQMRCYIDARYQYEEEFDWIGFIDADEYLALPDSRRLPEFLERSSEVGAVAINWCNYGSAGYILKPTMPAYYAYNKHFSKNSGVNRHVKSFIRPQCWKGPWINPHYFDVGPFQYEDSSGQPVAWSGIPGITAGEADWEKAKFMHYQCRSMEHFIERMRKRPDIRRDTKLWAASDQGEVEDNSPRSEHRHVARVMQSVVKASIIRVMQSLLSTYAQNNSNQQENPASHDFLFPVCPTCGAALLHASTPAAQPTHHLAVQSSGSVEIFRVVKHSHGSSLIVTSMNEVSDHGQVVHAIRVSTLPDKIFIFAASEEQGLILIDDDPRVCEFLVYEILPYGQNGQVALRHPSTGMYLTFSYSDTGNDVLASRIQLEECKPFYLRLVNDAEGTIDTRLDLVRAFLTRGINLNQFLFAHRENQLDEISSVFPVLVALTDQGERRQIVTACGAASRYIF